MLDAYTRKARLAPAVLAGLPALVLLIAAALKPTAESSQAAALIAALTLLICSVVRDRGRRIEPELWRAWGGPPTTARLRWLSPEETAATHSLHERVTATTGIALPDPPSEANAPEQADRDYEHAVLVLRERTRDTTAFPLVFAENAEYGFRRNLLGLRPLALAGTAITLVASIALIASGNPRYAAPAAVALSAAAVWWRLIRPDWVRLAAERYADRLLGAAVTLPALNAP
jgi:hypothetical protein